MDLDIALVGHIYTELIQFPNQEPSGPVMGGPVGHAAVIAALLGAKTGIVTKIGKDMPKRLIEVFDETGVDTLGMKIEEGKSTATLLKYDLSGKKEVEYFSKALDIYFDDIPTEYLDAKIIYICSVDYEVPLKTAEELRRHDKVLAVDLMGFGGATCRTHPDKDEKKYHRILREISQNFQIVRGSIEDCQYFFEDTEKIEEDIPNLFVEWGATIGIVTLGERGVLIASQDEKHRIPAFPVNAIDCTGAGDAFAAGFLVEYIKTKDLYRSGLFGNATASLVVEKSGGVTVERMPTYQEVKDRVNGKL